VRKREFEVLGEELLNIRTLHFIGLLKFNDLENLRKIVSYQWHPDEKYNVREST